MLESLISDLEGTAEWRRSLTTRFPEDSRNENAAALLDRLVSELASDPDSRSGLELERVHAELVRLSDGNHRYDLSALYEECDDYRRRIGFSVFPENGQAYLRALLEIYALHYERAHSGRKRRRGKPKAPEIFIDDEHGSYTRTEFRSLRQAEKLELMEAWFKERYQDPVHEMPRADGEYYYPWGGPFEASDVIQDEFGKFVPHELMERLIRKLNEESSRWAPTSKYWDRSEEHSDAPVEVGSISELEVRREIEAQLDDLEKRIAAHRSARHPLMGHNRPPDSVENEENSVLEPLSEAIIGLRGELSKPEPDVQEIAKQGGKLREIGYRIAGWLGRKVDLAVDEAAKEFGKRAIQSPFWIFVCGKLPEIEHILEHWLSLLS